MSEQLPYGIVKASGALAAKTRYPYVCIRCATEWRQPCSWPSFLQAFIHSHVTCPYWAGHKESA